MPVSFEQIGLRKAEAAYRNAHVPTRRIKDIPVLANIQRPETG